MQFATGNTCNPFLCLLSTYYVLGPTIRRGRSESILPTLEHLDHSIPTETATSLTWFYTLVLEEGLSFFLTISEQLKFL